MIKNITFVKLGLIDHLFDIRRIRTWKSDFFKVVNIQSIEHLPNTDVNDFYLDQKFTKEQLAGVLNHSNSTDITVGIMAYRFIDNFYMHRINGKSVIISLYGIKDILTTENISIENFILKQLYEISAISCLVNDISSDDVYNFVHQDTRGCIFDLNGDKRDILYNTEKPKICDSCKTEFRTHQVDENTIIKFEKELKRLKKPFIFMVEKFIQKYPLLSVILSGFIAIILNLTASALWDFIKVLLKINLK